ncbi:MAG: carboxypeptidase regulatory-like domain-containing protein [Bryobacteraceae bacterium]
MISVYSFWGPFDIGFFTIRAYRLLCAAMLLATLFPAAAQQVTGRIEGVVSDPAGARIPGVALTATHVETNAVFRGQSGADGGFAIPSVRLGRYRLAAEAAGFRRAVIEDVMVEVGGTAAVAIAMQVGTVQEEITVSADLAQVQINTVDAEIGTVVDNKRVLELPLNGRNAVELALQQTGVYFERTPDGQGDKLIVHGQRHRAINMTLDGIDTQDNLNRASSVMIDQPLLAMAAENVQEFRVVTGLASAEYSRGGAQINAVTRGGSNRIHGSLFWFNRNSAFSANEFFNNSASPKVETPPLNRNQFGGRIGGPILKDRTFFYLGYQQTRESRGTPVNRLVYTPEARQGMFRFLDGLRTTPENVAANADRIRAVDLMSCGVTALGRDCLDSRFTGGARPTFDPFIRDTVFGVIPLPNNTDIGDGLNTAGFRFNAKSITAEHLPSIRLDHRINDKHNFYATLNYVDRRIDGDYINDREPPYPAQGPLGTRDTLSKGVSATLTSTLTPTLVNEFRFGFLGGENAFLYKQPFGTPYILDLNTIYDPYDVDGNTNARDNRVVHVRNVANWMRGGHQLKFGGEFRNRYLTGYSFAGVNAAGTIGLDDDDNAPGFSNTDLTRTAGARAINTNDAETARDLMNNLVGAAGEIRQRFNVSSLTSGFVPLYPNVRSWGNNELDLFFNDSWRLRPNLTLNLGLRWEYAAVPYESNGLALAPQGGLSSVYGISGSQGFHNPGTLSGTPCPMLGGALAPTAANATRLLETCATQYFPAASKSGPPLWNNDWNNFGPVVSFAWDPFKDGRTSIRAGFRMSYMQDAYAVVDGNIDDNEGLEVNRACIPIDGNCAGGRGPSLLRDISGSNPVLPATPEFALPSSRSVLDSSTIDFRAFDQNLGTPYYNEWTFGISREISPAWTAEVRYVGNRGVGLRRVADYNEINVGARDGVSGQTFLDSFRIAQANLSCNNGSGFSGRFDDATGAACITANPLMTTLLAGDPTRLRNRAGLVSALERNETGQFVHRLTQVETSRPSSGQALIRGGSFWGQVLRGRLPANFFMANPFVASARAMVNSSFSNYHGLEIELRRRFARGLAVQANYTWNKALSDFDGDENTLVNDTRASGVVNPTYSKLEFMPRHQFNTNWLYELPLGNGRRWNLKGAADALLGGWQMGGLLTWRSGRPLSVTSNIGTFYRTAVSDDNTVNLTQNATRGDIRAMTGTRSVGGSLFWIDPCTSAFLGGRCTDSGAKQGLFDLPDSGSLGALGQTPLFGPQRVILDMSLMKRARVAEGKELEFRWEVFNALNKTNFAAPVLDITSTNFGQITRTVTNARLMQFAVKVNF